MSAPVLVTMRDALTDPRYFAEGFAGASWDKWRVILLAIAGEELTPDELPVFQALTNRQKAPTQPVGEFWGCRRPPWREIPCQRHPSGLAGLVPGLQGHPRARRTRPGADHLHHAGYVAKHLQFHSRRIRILTGVAWAGIWQDGGDAVAEVQH
jgi:hypothetical protein